MLRLVRASLRRHISGHGLLNAVFCSLPYFDADTVNKVVKLITEGDASDEDPVPIARVLTDAATVHRNPVLNGATGLDAHKMDTVMQALADVPSEHAPRQSLRPLPRFLALAKELSRDGLVEDGVKVSYELLNRELAALRLKHREAVDEAVKDIETVRLVEVHARLGAKVEEAETEKVEVAADAKTLADAFSVASRNLGKVIADEHVKFLLGDTAGEDLLDRLVEARVKVAAIGRQPDLVKALEEEAEKFTGKWLEDHHADVALLSAARQQIYTDIKTQSKEIQTSTIGQIVSDTVPTMIQEGEQKTPLETFGQHVLSLEDGQYPWQANKAEKIVLATERTRKGFLAWYRNPSRGRLENLRIAYERDDRWRMMHPDFIFFFQNAANDVVPVIVDPHGAQLSDSMPKLIGLARFTEKHGDAFARIYAVTDHDGGYVYLDMKSAEVRDAVRLTDDPKVIFASKHAKSYGK